MPYTDKNLAYDLSLFEPVSAKRKVKEKSENSLENKTEVIKIEELKTDEKLKVKKKPWAAIGYTLMVMIAASTFIAMLCGQAQLTELNQKISDATAVLEEKESIYIQTEMKVEAELSPEMLEYYATDVLGMTKIDNSKKEFIKLSEGDKATIAEEKKGTFGELLSDKIAAFWE